MMGIYCILNKLNKKCYIGSSNNLVERKKDHFTYSSNPHLRYSLQKYGKNNFDWNILQYCNTQDELVPTEQKYLDLAKVIGIELYNINLCANGGHVLGLKLSEYHKQKLRGRRKEYCIRGHKQASKTRYKANGECKICHNIRRRKI